jgi:hypothetical protein
LRNYILSDHNEDNKEKDYYSWLVTKVIDTILM